MDFSAGVKFTDICSILEKISKAESLKKKSDILKRFIESFNKNRAMFLQSNGENAVASFYPILRLLLSKSDNQRDAYGLRTNSLGKLFVRCLAISANSDDAKKLTYEQKAGGDFGDIVYEVMKNRSPAQGTLSVAEVNRYLDLMAEHFKNNERRQIDTEMIQMFSGMSALDRKWLTRIILRKLRLSLGQSRILQLYHKNAEEAYNQCGDLQRVCEIVDNGEEVNKAPLIEPFKALRPMLCERMVIHRIQEHLNANEYYLETKMDGERCHIHMKDNQFRYYSRNFNEFTTSYGSDPSGGSFTPILAGLLRSNVDSVILDGEMMVWNRDEQMYHLKAGGASGRFVQRNDLKLNPSFCVYDILYLNGVSLLDKPYAERVRQVRAIIKERPGYVTFCERVKVRDSEHILECLNKAIDDNEEGVVIKQIDSTYQPGRRDKGGWFKIKPDYGNDMVTDLDLLIIGGFRYPGKKAIKAFLLGVLKKDEDESKPEAGVFYAACRVGSGLSRDEYWGIVNKLEPHWNAVRSTKDGRSTISHNPPCMEWNNSPPDVWIEPKNSIILQIKATELAKTSTFRTTHAPRFPRVEKIRDDKNWYDACSLKEFEELCSTDSKVEKLAKRHYTSDDITGASTSKIAKRSQKAVPKITNILPGSGFQENIELVDDICHGKDFCLLTSGTNIPSKDELQRMILKHGGKVVVSPGLNTFICIANAMTLRIETLISTGKYNFAHVNWLLKALQSDVPQEELLPFNPNDMLYATNEMKEDFRKRFDQFGDSYTTPVDKAGLLSLLENISLEVLPKLDSRRLQKLECELIENPTNIFRTCVGYFCEGNESSDSGSLQLAKFMFRSKAGQVQKAYRNERDTQKLTHIFGSKDGFNWDALSALNIPFDEFKTIKVLDFVWILDCYNQNQLICDQSYILKQLLLSNTFVKAEIYLSP